MPPTSTSTPDGPEVVDCARWLADQPRPSLEVRPLRYGPADRRRTGHGVRIALLGGRVDTTHPDLRQASVTSRTEGRHPAPADPAGQATACASLLVGQGHQQVRGLVPRADLLVATVLDPDARPADQLVVRAVHWALREGAQVIVLPFGRRRPGRGVATTLRAAAEEGVQVLVSAGDLGPDVLTFPGSVSGVVAVTAHDGRSLLPGCSSRADLAAPGHAVPAAGPGRTLLLRGTGPATVLAAGAWAGLAHEVVGRRDRGEAHQRDRFIHA
ncbi:S8/S53 family peptidase [Actinotalea sp. K2]|uniref:S8/S53 family peptidase n=1 Tax=Actinotalea sp. K2 TaxID=2939438 RepID=UPI0020181C25|nr:S8/S53 family peptidase [Actinotalea sp. K2]MCL3860040.1 S8/S53 family peptidase [Actinotalea sp. K2]